MAEDVTKKYNFGKNCVCVGRVSTSQQSQTAQIEDLTKYAKSLGFKKIKTFFTTESGFLETDQKQGWNLVVDFFEKNPDYHVLICSEISRLSRKESILHIIKQYLVDHKIQLIIKDINYFLYNEYGTIPAGNDIVFSLYASLANSEMIQKRERFKRGLIDNRKLGYSIGGKELFGYDRVYEEKDGRKRSKYVINKKESREILNIYRWYAYGIDRDLSKTSLLSITRKCIEDGYSSYLHSKRNVNKCLKEKAYCGIKETHNRTKNPAYWNYKKLDEPKYIKANSYVCTYPPIFSGEDASLFELVQQRLVANNSKIGSKGGADKSTSHTTILSKLLICPCCGTFLHGEYRKRIDARRPHLGERSLNVYRCNYSRGTIKQCDFKHIMSMPMLDSVIWAYCQKAVIAKLREDDKESIDKQSNEINEKIKNIRTKIANSNKEARIKAEETILRSKTAIANTTKMQDKAIQEYKERIKAIEKEFKEYEIRILELEQEKEQLKNKKSLLSKYDNHKQITSNKKQIYSYIHQLVESIKILYSNKYVTLLQIHLKLKPVYYVTSEFILIQKRTTKTINAFTIHSKDDESFKNVSIEVANKEGRADSLVDTSFELKIPFFSHMLWWNDEEKSFYLGMKPFSLMIMYDCCDKILNDKRSEIERFLENHEIVINKLECERLNCYQEDNNQSTE